MVDVKVYHCSHDLIPFNLIFPSSTKTDMKGTSHRLSNVVFTFAGSSKQPDLEMQFTSYLLFKPYASSCEDKFRN